METGKEMFDSAWSDEPLAEAAPEEPSGDAEAAQAAEAQPPEQEAAEPEAKVPDEDLDGEGDPESPQDEQPKTRRPRVPLDELLTEREKRKEFEVKHQLAEERMRELERRIQELSAPKQGQQQPEQGQPKEQTFWDDPEGYFERMLQSTQAQVKQRDFEWSMRLGEMRYGDEFKEAYKFADQRVDIDPAFRVQLLTSQDPADVIMTAYRQHKLVEEVGDPATYRQKLLSDPEHLAEALKAAEALARQTQPQTGQSAPNVQIPPSLSRTTAAAPNGNPDDRAMTGRELFDDAFSGLPQA